MKIEIEKQKMSLVNFMRKLGYFSDKKHDGEQSFSRRLRGSKFPRFHVYVDESKDSWTIKLHLDQKAVSYEGHNAHSGEYDGRLVEEEMERIKGVTEKLIMARKKKVTASSDRNRKTSFWKRLLKGF